MVSVRAAKSRLCKRCGKSIDKTSPQTRLCVDCKPLARKESLKKFAPKGRINSQKWRRSHGIMPRIIKGWYSSDGYKILSINGKRIPEHRHIMQLYINRKLNKTEHVHHINGIRHDNRIKNLQVMDVKEHGSLEGKKSKGVPKPNARRDKIYAICENCHKYYVTYPSWIKAGRRFCSNKCKFLFG